jgi:propionyl-CoA carboxylase alpha chain
MTPIRRVLVANRGEIARRVFRTCRQMGIATAAVYADPDRAAPYVREADVAVALDGHTAAETYLSADRLIAAARRVQADAVHPGYGFLAENAAFARAVIDAGLVWVGPPPECIAAMGDKLAAKRLVAGAGVPVLRAVALDGAEPTALVDEARAMGFPVLIKAAGGGGGRGMRIVADAAALPEAAASARREALAAFSDDRVFLERYVESPRHVEIQILADHHGNVIHLFERECSIQRRHQKIIEETPSPGVTSGLRERMTAAALTVAKVLGYASAGTVEFLVDAEGAFHFLEVNTRIQVEHPVTEAVTGVDLVREQLLIAEGRRLGLGQRDVVVRGHAVEARLYAEDPANGFLPTGGRLLDWRPAGGLDVRVDSGVEAGTEIAVAFDPMIAKVIAHAATRAEAVRRLAAALEGLMMPGVVTNRDFLVNVLRHPAFLGGETTTDFIDRHRPGLCREVAAADVGSAALAAALASQVVRRAQAEVLRTIPPGWRNNASGLQEARYRVDSREVVVGYRRERDGGFVCAVDGVALRARVFAAALPRLDLEIDGVRRGWWITFGLGGLVYVQDARGEVRLQELPRFPEPVATEVATGGYVAPMPGKVIEIRVGPGDLVEKGQLLVALEAMKMEHQVIASSDGVVSEVRVARGQQVDVGEVLLVVDAREETSPDGG